MPFNNDVFLFAFLPSTLAGFVLIARLRPALGTAWLVAASLAAYAWWNPALMWVPIVSALFTFGVALAITRAPRGAPRGRALLALGVAANVSYLACFKALDSPWFGAPPQGGAYSAAAAIAIPLGISFITFQQIAFLVDVHRGRIAKPRLLEFLFVVFFFPKLVAGPIVNYRDIAPQLSAPGFGRVRSLDLACGLAILTVGLFKKVGIADALAPYVDRVYLLVATGEAIRPIDALAAFLAFPLQIYFDFSGYADMAIGVSRMFGVRLPINFDAPARAVDRFDFWRRWHITFAVFMREYVFHPLARNRVVPMPLWAALFLTALLAGLWHGLGSTFLVWGLLQAAMLVGAHAARRRFPAWAAAHRQRGAVVLLRMGFAFLVTAALSVIFRAPDLASALEIFGRIAALSDLSAYGPPTVPVPGAYLALAFAVAWTMPTSQAFFERVWTGLEPRPPRDIPRPIEPSFTRRIRFDLTPGWAIFVAVVLVAAIYLLYRTSRLVYNQF